MSVKRYYIDECISIARDAGNRDSAQQAETELDALQAELARVREAVDWVLNDMQYKAPEQVGPALAVIWYSKLKTAARWREATGKGDQRAMTADERIMARHAYEHSVTEIDPGFEHPRPSSGGKEACLACGAPEGHGGLQCPTLTVTV